MKEYLKDIYRYYLRNFELLFWIMALIALASMNPEVEGASLCPYTFVTGNECWGCGLGHSISWLFRGEFIKSLDAHILGPFAVVVILLRLVTIFRNMVRYHAIKQQKIEDHG